MHKMQQKYVGIGPALQKCRKQATLSQERVAAQLQLRGLNISREIVSRIECGKHNIRLEVLLALSEIYRVPIQDFFKEAGF